MSAANYQQHPSDILEERVDSAPVLTDRLVSWHHAVGVVLEYAEQEYAAQSSVSSHLAKQRKTVNQIPSFSGASVTGGSDARTAAAPSAEDGVSGAFLTLSQQNDVLLRESESAAQSIKASVIPALETLYADLEKHHKTLKTQGAKAVKEIEKSRDHRAKGAGSIAVPHLYVVREDGEPHLRLWAQSMLVEDRADQSVSLVQWMGSLREKV